MKIERDWYCSECEKGKDILIVISFTYDLTCKEDGYICLECLEKAIKILKGK